MKQKFFITEKKHFERRKNSIRSIEPNVKIGNLSNGMVAVKATSSRVGRELEVGKNKYFISNSLKTLKKGKEFSRVEILRLQIVVLDKIIGARIN